ncbi:hypothetical protein MPH_04036 [Macrophomina phaseolina MS6]|uniref:Uncharacterized protein n=1 Tax=Macrophomina phaseolina (strain MS6) TaxID=1126212 RepID=K2SPI7_MACPH|nr:hypothetical protein MPH_04036 [Macrophomina phaseolina MS6]
MASSHQSFTGPVYDNGITGAPHIMPALERRATSANIISWLRRRVTSEAQAPEEPYHPSIRRTATVIRTEALNMAPETRLGAPQVWGARPLSRSQSYNETIQQQLLQGFVHGEREIPVHVLLMADDTRVTIRPSMFDSLMLPENLYCFDWWSFVGAMKRKLSYLDGRELTFRQLRDYLGEEMTPYMSKARTFDEWQRMMIVKDHICQLVIVNCGDVAEARPRPSFIRRITGNT